jgi:hypothetical protein
MDETPVTRAELLAPYEHPYREWLPAAVSRTRARRTLATGILATVVTALPLLFGASSGWAALPVVFLLATLVGCVMDAVPAVLAVRERTRGWDEAGELARVRAGRPHAAERDPRLVHDEFAVTVEDSGRLFVWRFVPLAAAEPSPASAVEVPGRPRYAASVVQQRPLDVADTARAAEQLVEAQEHAAVREAAAADAARRALVDQHEAERRAADAAAAAATLQHLTGQAPREP